MENIQNIEIRTTNLVWTPMATIRRLVENDAQYWALPNTQVNVDFSTALAAVLMYSSLLNELKICHSTLSST